MLYEVGETSSQGWDLEMLYRRPKPLLASEKIVQEHCLHDWKNCPIKKSVHNKKKLDVKAVPSYESKHNTQFFNSSRQMFHS